MDDGPKNWRECYRHPKKPAIRDCSCCGRPICKECASESGDPALCAPCKESLFPVEEKTAAMNHLDPIEPTLKRDARVSIAELTVLDNGKIRSTPEQASLKDGMEKPEATAVVPGAAQEPPVEPGWLGPHAPLTGDRKREKSLEKAVTEKQSEESLGGSDLPAAVGKAEQSTNLPQTNTSKQLLDGMFFALVVSVAAFGFWLMLAIIEQQWSNGFAIVTCGVAVPWAFFRGTTWRKRKGEKVWSESPETIWISTLSVVTIAGLIPLAELLAYMILSRSDAELQFSGFMEQYFRTADWILVIASLVLAFFIPFLLEAGEGGRKMFIWGKKRY